MKPNLLNHTARVVVSLLCAVPALVCAVLTPTRPGKAPQDRRTTSATPRRIGDPDGVWNRRDEAARRRGTVVR